MRAIFLWSFLGMFCFIGKVKADWNDKFDRQSHTLIQQMTEFQGEYQDIYSSFAKMRKGVLKDFLLQKQLSMTTPDQRMVLLRPKEGVVIKKRAQDAMAEVFSWEMSYLLGGGSFLLPSFPVSIAGRKVILQKMEPFSFKKEKVMDFVPKEAKKITIEEYWKAHLQAYLLGLEDLVGQNIGISPLNHIRFFDAESAFFYQNQPIRTSRSFKPGFMSQSLEWPQYRQALDAKTVSTLRKIVDALSTFESKLEQYLSIRPAPVEIEELLFRLEKVRSFSFKEGATFKDFYAHVFPRMGEGLDELSQIASDILQRKVDHGSALILTSRWIESYELSSSQKQAVENWIQRYID